MVFGLGCLVGGLLSLTWERGVHAKGYLMSNMFRKSELICE